MTRVCARHSNPQKRSAFRLCCQIVFREARAGTWLPRHPRGSTNAATAPLDSGEQLAYECPPYGRTRLVASSRGQIGPTQIYFVAFGILTLTWGDMGSIND